MRKQFTAVSNGQPISQEELDLIFDYTCDACESYLKNELMGKQGWDLATSEAYLMGNHAQGGKVRYCVETIKTSVQNVKFASQFETMASRKSVGVPNMTHLTSTTTATAKGLPGQTFSFPNLPAYSAPPLAYSSAHASSPNLIHTAPAASHQPTPAQANGNHHVQIHPPGTQHQSPPQTSQHSQSNNMPPPYAATNGYAPHQPNGYPPHQHSAHSIVKPTTSSSAPLVRNSAPVLPLHSHAPVSQSVPPTHTDRPAMLSSAPTASNAAPPAKPTSPVDAVKAQASSGIPQRSNSSGSSGSSARLKAPDRKHSTGSSGSSSDSDDHDSASSSRSRSGSASSPQIPSTSRVDNTDGRVKRAPCPKIVKQGYCSPRDCKDSHSPGSTMCKFLTMNGLCENKECPFQHPNLVTREHYLKPLYLGNGSTQRPLTLAEWNALRLTMVFYCPIPMKPKKCGKGIDCKALDCPKQHRKPPRDSLASADYASASSSPSPGTASAPKKAATHPKLDVAPALPPKPILKLKDVTSQANHINLVISIMQGGCAKGLKPPKITKLEEISNSVLDDQYRAYFMKTQQNKGMRPSELYAFHGAPTVAVMAIAANGFDMSKIKRTKFGHGLYCALDPNVSMEYCQTGNQMLLVRLITDGLKWVKDPAYYVIQDAASMNPLYIVTFAKS